ncbi:MAG: hypothetical protein EU536_01750 [Promethearchaeota archaeon]|nr:MAG: hypothetical protein EU536_01750 [Candidatus Lokiarchaeota archaeon]
MKKKLPILAGAICAILVVTLILVFVPLSRDKAPIIGTPMASNVFATENIQISVSVSDDGEVADVILSYSNDSKATWYNVTMSGSGSTTWVGTGTISPHDIEVTLYYKIYAQDNIGQWSVKDNAGAGYELYTGSRKAFIVCSANDFYGSEEEDSFNGGPDANFSEDTGHWLQTQGVQIVGQVDPSAPGHLTNPGAFHIESTGVLGSAEFVYNWTAYYSLENYAFYNFSIWLNTQVPIVGAGVKIGLQWLNSTDQEVRTDWSGAINDTGALWAPLRVAGVCNNDSGNEITQLQLKIAVNGAWGLGSLVLLDDVFIDRWITVNLTDPFNPDPPARNKNCDGFPAQALQVYKVLKGHGYSDENIFFMLYWANDADGVIDIVCGDNITNDLDGTVVIDVLDAGVNASRVKQELNVSVAGSFASSIQENDQLIIFMTDHGSTMQLPDRNATFHFEADGSFITEFEFYELVSQIDCWRMMINMDCCFSGNFLNQNASIGASWYDLPNCIFVSAAANVLSWYWVDCNNGDGFAGSWFFHVFWDQLDQNQTINNAFLTAQAFVPFGKGAPLAVIQVPLIQDNLGIMNTWSFTSFSKL